MPPWRIGTSSDMMDTEDATELCQIRDAVHSQAERADLSTLNFKSNSAAFYSLSLRKIPSLPSALVSSSSSKSVLSTLALGCHEPSTVSCTWYMVGMQLMAASVKMTLTSSVWHGHSLLFWGTKKAETPGSVFFLSQYILKCSQDDPPPQFSRIEERELG